MQQRTRPHLQRGSLQQVIHTPNKLPCRSMICLKLQTNISSVSELGIKTSSVGVNWIKQTQLNTFQHTDLQSH